MASNVFAVDPAEKRIAVLVDREGLGDCLLKIPFLRALRRAYPTHKIWWIATHQTAMEDDLAPWVLGPKALAPQVLGAGVAPLIARVISRAGLTSPDREIIPRLRQLPPFDLVFDTRTRLMTVLLARLNLKHRGFYACMPGFVLSDRLPPGRWRRPTGIAERMLTMIEAATGRAADWRGTFDVSDAAQRLAAERLPAEARYIGLAPGSREARKNWPLERYMVLASALAGKGYTPAFLIGPQERDWLATLRDGVPQALFPEAEAVDPALGIGRLEFAIALAHRLAATVANDSGIGHLMAAIGTPLVSLFGPSDAARWAPYGERVVIVQAQEFGGDMMEAIPVDAVSGAVDRLLKPPEVGAS
jgi:ADP-heptose:LPS heptosyltransferase